jgi:hypothetical protein
MDGDCIREWADGMSYSLEVNPFTDIVSAGPTEQNGVLFAPAPAQSGHLYPRQTLPGDQKQWSSTSAGEENPSLCINAKSPVSTKNSIPASTLCPKSLSEGTGF